MKKVHRLKFFLDENVDVRLATILRKKGHEAIICPKGLQNGEVFALAQKESCIFLTNDKHFTQTSLFNPKKSAGIIVFYIHPPKVINLASALARLLSIIDPSEFSRKLFMLREDGVELVKEN